MPYWIQDRVEAAQVMICGEAPGSTEWAQKRPFVGASGYLIDGMLRDAGIDRASCFVTNLCHVQPPKNDFAWFTKTREGFTHLELGLAKLLDDIDKVKPNLIVCLGGEPLKYLTGKDSITKWRGSILSGPKGVKVMATYHPAFIFRSYDHKAVVAFDLSRMAVQAKFPEVRLPQRNLILDPDVATMYDVAEEMLRAEALAVDIECWPHADGRWVDDHGQHRIACIAFADSASRAMVLPLDTIDRFEQWEVTKRLLASPIPKVFQNGVFDVSVLAASGVVVNNFSFDTMLAHHACYVECATGEGGEAVKTRKSTAALQKGLAFLTSIHTDEPFYKDDGKLWKTDGDINKFWRYNALDAAVTFEVHESQKKDLTELNAWPAFNHSMSLIEPTMKLTQRGIRIDVALKERLRAEYTADIERMSAELAGTVGRDTFNVSGRKDMAWLLYDKLGFKERRNKKGNVTADEATLVKFSGKSGNPLLRSVLDIREKRALLERSLDMEIDPDGRCRCSWELTGTKTWRLSSRSNSNGTGTNLQNINDEMRRMFIPDPGKVFVVADYKQAEAVIVAYLSRDLYLIDLFKDPTRDIHKETASRIFGKPISEITYEERYIGKRIRHAANYGMDAAKFVEVVNKDAHETGVTIDLPLARKALEGIFLMHPNHKSVYWGGVALKIKQTRRIENAFGFSRTFFGRYDDNLLRSAYAQSPQSTVGVLCTKALRRCYDTIEVGRPDLSFELLTTVHDSIHGQCPPSSVPEVVRLMREAMNIPITINHMTFTIAQDFATGGNWAKASKENPDGLKEWRDG